MESLLWCFLSIRGELGRRQFALAFLALVLLDVAADRLIRDLIVGLHPDWDVHQLLGSIVVGQLMVALLFAWPSFAISAKRLRDIGYPIRYLVVAYGAFAIVERLSSPAAMALQLIVASFLLFAKKRR